MERWDKVFTAGKHTDSSGNVKNWTTADLDRMVSSFNPAFHEPPVVLGHPSDNAPAFGWVAGIKRVGNDLYLQYRDVADQFKEWVSQGLYKKKSIAVYPDGSLRHIGYLGAMPPAIKGLPDYQFKSDQEFSTFACDDQVDQDGIWNCIKNFVSSLTSLPIPTAITNNPSFTETKEEDMTKEEVQVIVADSTKEFTEQLKALGDTMKSVSETMKAMDTQFSEIQKASEAARIGELERGFREFLESPDMLKRVPEGSRAATIAQMVTLAAAPAVEFGEGAEKKSVAALDNYKTQLQSLPEIIAFGEHATKDKVGDVMVNGMSAVELSQKAVEFQESEAAAGRDISMTVAVNHVKKGGK